ncbi:NfeD family protein [Alicyclobacillus cycloheptanicus]|uniref:Membrane protein implicated in regulation of membrane protease activity n=1 Tax=Alicyclobacillus cycloheptanicus TaxID=1457 RepID=A0ABT9XM06_9BACL|nr:NfeD family protein [Alicyclobacillus cycloheptanicus]MDQ0191348.1 membrane protein implicated in regulation of membrane protease activity [Alicyclobacillus cycloheptanicus]WDL99831.1 NfeD family protein [Alicyclobacillus cycloheptanicus]
MAWWIWFVIAVVLGVIELTSVTFVLLWIAIAALLASVSTIVIPSLWGQAVVFAVASIILYLASRPLARRWKRSRRPYETHLASRVNQTGVVVRGALPGAFATVRVQGELWSATCTERLEPGQQVIVTDASGTVLTVVPDGSAVDPHSPAN